jgi:hypothetical protein
MFTKSETIFRTNKAKMLLERWLDPDAYLDDMESLEQKEREAEHLLDQQEKHDD